MLTSIPVDLTTPADHELFAQRKVELDALIEQRTTELATAKDVYAAAIEEQGENDGVSWSLLDEGCQCPHVMAPCSFCETASEAVVEAMDAMNFAQLQLDRAQRELREAKQAIAPRALRVQVVPEPELGCQDSGPTYAFTAFDMGVAVRKCTSRATWRIKSHDGTFTHVCDHCCQWNHSKWSEPVKSPIYTHAADRRTGNMSCADRIRALAHAARLIADGEGGRQINEPTPGVAHMEDLVTAFEGGARTPGAALASAIEHTHDAGAV